MYPLYNLWKFVEATTILAGATVWWRKGTREEDEMISYAADVVLDNLSDSDNVRKIKDLTGKDLRDQLTVEEAMELDKERTLRRFSRRN